MGCLGGKSDDGFGGIWWIIILILLFFCFCNNDSNFLSDIFEGCDTLVVIAIILLVISLCDCNNSCTD